MPQLRYVSIAFFLLCGCAHRSQWEVKRWCADWNSERECNAQVESFDHLPPKPTRVRLMRWGYNVGPADCIVVPEEKTRFRTWLGGFMPWTGLGNGVETTSEIVPGSTTITPSTPERVAPPPESVPQLPPPAPPAEPPPDPDYGPQAKPMASLDAVVRQAGYRGAIPPRQASTPTWIFTPAKPAR